MSSQLSRKNKDDQKREVMVRRPFDNLFDNFRQDMEDAFFTPFMNPLKTFGNSRNMDFIETRIPLCDILDKGDRYSISLEVPGIQKDKIEVKATEEYITISGIDEKKNEEKEDNYVLNERTYRSFSRKIPFPENIVPSKVDATVENGILKIEVPKQKPTSIEETKIKIR
ncbi:MAG TPA: Hsp20/alpha crystallin family protein [Nitrososphaeraceae archaeon]|nr:Hsp20/alpha crystallin family protein [Nitrososphaeraceae archaeon]